MHAERKPGIKKSQYDLTVEMNRLVTKHIRRKGDAHEIVVAALAVLSATIRSMTDENHKVHYTNQVMQSLAQAALAGTTVLNKVAPEGEAQPKPPSVH